MNIRYCAWPRAQRWLALSAGQCVWDIVLGVPDVTGPAAVLLCISLFVGAVVVTDRLVMSSWGEEE